MHCAYGPIAVISIHNNVSYLVWLIGVAQDKSQIRPVSKRSVLPFLTLSKLITL